MKEYKCESCGSSGTLLEDTGEGFICFNCRTSIIVTGLVLGGKPEDETSDRR